MCNVWSVGGSGLIAAERRDIGWYWLPGCHHLLSCRESHAYDRSDRTFTELLNGVYYLLCRESWMDWFWNICGGHILVLSSGIWVSARLSRVNVILARFRLRMRWDNTIQRRGVVSQTQERHICVKVLAGVVIRVRAWDSFVTIIQPYSRILRSSHWLGGI